MNQKNAKPAEKRELQPIRAKQPVSVYYVPDFDAVIEAVDAKDAVEKVKKGKK